MVRTRGPLEAAQLQAQRHQQCGEARQQRDTNNQRDKKARAVV